MRVISVSYVCMLLICVSVGMIVALMCKYSLWWVFSLLIPALLAWMPLMKLRKNVCLNPGFSMFFFAVAFLLWLVLAAIITNYMNIESFFSVMSVVATWSAVLMTEKLIPMIHTDKSIKA